jgi:L-alanine-DL-glutamate epimerase-like enolase superfamily enzyme
MARRFEEFGLFWLEEPLPPGDLEGYARLADALDMRIAAGEQETTYRGLVELAATGHVDVRQPDVSRADGLTQCMRVRQPVGPRPPHSGRVAIFTTSPLDR